MKSTTTFRALFLAVTALTVFSCKQAPDTKETEVTDSTTITTEVDTVPTPDTTSMPAPGTPVDTTTTNR